MGGPLEAGAKENFPFLSLFFPNPFFASVRGRACLCYLLFDSCANERVNVALMRGLMFLPSLLLVPAGLAFVPVALLPSSSRGGNLKGISSRMVLPVASKGVVASETKKDKRRKYMAKDTYFK